MKKSILLLAIAAFFMVNHAIGQSFEKGNSVLNLGIGVGGIGLDAPGISASYEVGMFPVGNGFGVIGIGGLFGFNSEKQFGLRVSALGLAPRGTFHFTIIPVEKLDVYAALEPFTFVFAKVNVSGNSTSDTSIDIFSTSAGARYYFSEGFAVFAETGYSFNYLTGGISLKF